MTRLQNCRPEHTLYISRLEHAKSLVGLSFLLIRHTCSGCSQSPPLYLRHQYRPAWVNDRVVSRESWWWVGWLIGFVFGYVWSPRAVFYGRSQDGSYGLREKSMRCSTNHDGSEREYREWLTVAVGFNLLKDKITITTKKRDWNVSFVILIHAHCPFSLDYHLNPMPAPACFYDSVMILWCVCDDLWGPIIYSFMSPHFKCKKYFHLRIYYY